MKKLYFIVFHSLNYSAAIENSRIAALIKICTYEDVLIHTSKNTAPMPGKTPVLYKK